MYIMNFMFCPVPLMPPTLIIPSSLVGTMPHPRGIITQRPRGWVLDRPPSSDSPLAGGQKHQLEWGL
jgi:hypothetical protein